MMTRDRSSTLQDAVWISAAFPVDRTPRAALNTRRPARAIALVGLSLIGAAVGCVLFVGRSGELGQRKVGLLGNAETARALRDDPLVALLRGNTRDARNRQDDFVSDRMQEGEDLVNSQKQQETARQKKQVQVSAESIVAQLAREDGEDHRGTSSRGDLSLPRLKGESHNAAHSASNSLSPGRAQDIVAALAREDGFQGKSEQASFSASFLPSLRSSLAALTQSLSLRGGRMIEPAMSADDEQGLTGFQPSADETARAVQSVLDALDFGRVGGGGLLKAALGGEETALARYEEGELDWGCQEMGEGGRGGLARVAGELEARLEETQAEGYARIDAMNATEKRARAATEVAAEELLERVRALRRVCEQHRSDGAARAAATAAQRLRASSARAASENGAAASENGAAAPEKAARAAEHAGGANLQRRVEGPERGPQRGELAGLSARVEDVDAQERELEAGEGGSGLTSVAAMITAH